MKKTKKLALLFLTLIVLISFSGCGCKQQQKLPYVINLEIWGLFENGDPYVDIFQEYKKNNSNIGEIRYKKMNTDSYQKDLIEALASGQGPDIFLVHNNWIPSFQDKIYPAPNAIVNEQQVHDEFVDVVYNDFVSEGGVYALPLSVDSLGLYYNKDLFNEAGITSPPKNWDEFIADARKLTKLDQQSQILQSGAALGTSGDGISGGNINRATDILNLLMLQNDTSMVDVKTKKAVFDQYQTIDGKTFSPGENALNFYTQFANRSSQTVPYTWNKDMHHSIDAFSEGKLAMMFNYSWQMEVIDSKSPKLNYAVAKVPQFSGSRQANFANYWGYAVAKNRTPDTKGTEESIAKKITNDMRAEEAWSLLSYMTMRFEKTGTVSSGQSNGQPIKEEFDAARNYMEKTKKPAARRDLVEIQKTDLKCGVFAQGNLIAKSWYQKDPDFIESVFAEMITKINKGESTAHDSLHSAAQSLTQIMSK